MTKIKKCAMTFSDLYNAFIAKRNPISLILYVTEKCNAKCPHCFLNFEKRNKDLTLEEIEKITKSVGNNIKNVSLTGGETFLREDLFEIANLWHKNTTANFFSITSNGSMPEKIESFCKKATLTKLPAFFFLSYDFIEERHSEYRGIKDLHLKVVESYKIIKKYGFNATLQLTLSPETVNTAFETYCYMRDILKIQNINCNLIRGEKSHIISQEERRKIALVYEQIQKEMDSDYTNNNLQGFNKNSIFNNVLNAKNRMIWKYILKTFSENKFISPCVAGALMCVIYSDGSVYPCELLDKTFGNLKDYNFNLKDCLRDKKAKEIKCEICQSKCFCTYEFSWLLNIFSHPRYYPELALQLLKGRNI